MIFIPILMVFEQSSPLILAVPTTALSDYMKIGASRLTVTSMWLERTAPSCEIALGWIVSGLHILARQTITVER
jgi:4-amino-4-deoxy-L-arabinose transferase-like glycosyltransferase